MKKNIFSMWNSKPFRIYIVYSQEKKLCFSMSDKKPFDLNTSS